MAEHSTLKTFIIEKIIKAASFKEAVQEAQAGGRIITVYERRLPEDKEED